MGSSVEKVVLAYSGGLDTSIIVKWLREQYGCEVIAYTADVGQEEELDGLEAKAIRTGASKIYIEDLKEEFARDFVYFAIKANAVYENSYLLGTSIARPLIAKRQVEIAAAEKADSVCHGSTGKGNDQVRFELTYYALAPQIKVIAPWREWSFSSREELIDYARKHDIDVPVSKAKPYSMDRNLMHVSYEGGVLEDPWSEPDESMFRTTVSPEARPGQAALHRNRFRERGAGKGRRQSDEGARAHRPSQPCRRRQRHRQGRHGGEQVRRHEVARGLRNAGLHYSPRGASGHRVDHHGPGGHAPEG